MILKGSARSAPGELAHHLLREDTNESVRVLELRGVASLDLLGALAELDGMGAGARSRRPLYHASINTPVSEQLTAEQQRIARERLAAKMGLEGQPYAVVEHVKAGRQHTHIVWSRIDQATGKAIPDSHNYRRHEEVARELEREFGHAPVLGVHVRDKETEPRPARTPSWGEQRQAERSGLTPQEAKRQITELWQQTRTGDEFAAALAEAGYTLARGDRRDFVLLDQAGEVHGLSRRIEGVKAAQVRERMAGIDADRLPTVDQAQGALRQTREATQSVLGGTEIAGPVPEAALRASVEVESAAREQKPILEPPQAVDAALPDSQQDRARHLATRDPGADRERDRDRQPEPYRPSAVLFVQVFGFVIEAYQRALDLARELLSGRKTDPEPARPPSFDPRFAREELTPARYTSPVERDMRSPRQVTLDNIKARQVREREERPQVTFEELKAMLQRDRSREVDGFDR